MTSLKTKNICFLAAFLFLAIVPTLAEVVDEVNDCNQFLHDETPPKIPGILEGGVSQNNNRYKVICQTYNGVQRFLTVYDIVKKIPVFSAYEYRGSEGDRPDVTWMIEPQLDVQPAQDNINMRTQGRTTCNNQAVNADYDGNGRGYAKGHLFPVNHATTDDDKISTFTLTNAVPQVDGFNGGRWRVMEGKIKDEMDQNIFSNNNGIRCFVVVGAKPGNTNLNDNNNIANNIAKKEVNIPSMMWSAFRCTNGVSGAYWDDNIKRDPPRPMEKKTLQQLQDELDNLTIDPTLKGITVFPQKQPGLKRSSSNSQQPQAGPSKQPRKSRSPSSSAGKS